jgi:hypothetical protein
MNPELAKVINEKLKCEFNIRETIQVLGRNMNIFWSWGVTTKANFNNKGLLLKVSGHHHKGYVLITLAWDDTYTVDIISTHGNVKDTYTEIYVDNLVETIDDRIERIEKYVN